MEYEYATWYEIFNAVKNLDMDYARREFPHASSDLVRLISLHKARQAYPYMPEELRKASEIWLHEHGYLTLHERGIV